MSPNLEMAKGEPPLSERALKYGRNVIAVSSVIIVLAWVPGIEPKSFTPFGFKVSNSAELSIWALLCAALGYYAISFGITAMIDVRAWMWAEYDEFRHLEGFRRNMRVQKRSLGHKQSQEMRNEFRKQHGLLWDSRLRMWCLDIGFPVLMCLLAVFAAVPHVFGL